MATTNYPTNYLDFTAQAAKKLNFVVCFDDIPTCFGLLPTYRRVRYGDPDIFYGTPGLVYGSLKKLDNVKDFLSFETTLNISQRIEPEQGRGNISQITLNFIDKNGEMSALISPGGGVVDEMLGRGVTIRVGYQNTSYPDDYFVAFRGLVVGLNSQTGRVLITLGDPGQKRRQYICRTEKTRLSAGIDASQLNIPLDDTAGFYQWPSASLTGVKTYIVVEDEIMEYGYGAVSPAQITVSSRGQRGTTAAVHAIDSEVSHAIELTGNAITLALRIMLSGWNGPYRSNVATLFLGFQPDPSKPAQANLITLPQELDAQINFGLTIGDSITVSASSASNNGTYTVTGFQDYFGLPNRLIEVSLNLNFETPSTSLLALRSKYDVLPIGAALKMSPEQVDVSSHEALRDNYLSGPEYTLSHFISTQQSGKTFCEMELFLPIACYSLTRYGRLSIGYTRPPLASEKLIELNSDNVIEPQNIQITRGLNVRTFYNEIAYEYDKADAGNYQSIVRVLDTNSLNKIGLSSILPIKAAGVKGTPYAGGILANRVARRLLTRYKKAAVVIDLTVSWNPGTLIEAGDVVLLRDDGGLQITNFDTGERDIVAQLYEVIDRNFDVKTGSVKLKLVSGLGNNLSDRYGTISPSSIVGTGSSASSVAITLSYGRTSNEWAKWTQYVGLPITVHSPDYTTRNGSSVLSQIEPTDPYLLNLATPLSFTPQPGDIVEIQNYPTSTVASENQIYKVIHAFVGPTGNITGGTSSTVFSVDATTASRLASGQYVSVHNGNYTIASDEVIVSSVVGTTVTVGSSLGFTPSAGQKLELIGFADGGGAYRIV